MRIQLFTGKSQSKNPLRRPKLVWEDNMQTDVGEIRREMVCVLKLVEDAMKKGIV
jgi:hypothetical protein